MEKEKVLTAIHTVMDNTQNAFNEAEGRKDYVEMGRFDSYLRGLNQARHIVKMSKPLDTEVVDVLFELAGSHSILAAAEYKRDVSYNDSHFSARAERNLLALIEKLGLRQDLLKYLNEYTANNEKQ